MDILAGGMKAVFDEKRASLISIQGEDGQGGFRDMDYLLTPTEFPEYDVPDARWLGNLFLTVESQGKRWSADTGSSADIRQVSREDGKILVSYNQDSVKEHGMKGIRVYQMYEWKETGIRWTIRLKNPLNEVLTVRKLGIPLMMNQFFRGDNQFKYDKCVLRHTCITHHHSYIYWATSGNGTQTLLLQALGDTPLMHFSCEEDHPVFGRKGSMGSAFEGCFYVYLVHEKTPFSHIETSALVLEQGEEKEFSFFLGIEKDFEALEVRIVANGGITAQAVPGMCVPCGEEVKLIIDGGEGVEICLPDEGDELLGMDCMCERKVAKLRLAGYGVRNVWLRKSDTVMKLQFFAMEPLEDIIRSQSAFIAAKQFETEEADPCYHGLLMWDMTARHRVNSSCNPFGADWMAGGSDEIGLVSGLFLSGKNVYLPDEKEVRVLNDYVKDFLVERLTEHPGYRVHRMVPWFQMFEPWAGYGADDVWRAYNYVHVINTVYNMYRISSLYSFDFLEEPVYYITLAYEYMKAMFTYWMFPDGVGATKYANMGELHMALSLEGDLRKEGLASQADWVRQTVEMKAYYFASKEYPYGSEMPYDSTAFEAVYAYGKAAGDSRVMERSCAVACANRGRQPVWYLYCTDLRQMGDSSWNVSYMTQLGAYPIYDWLFSWKKEEERKACLGEIAYLAQTWYASYLAGWSLYNSGGFWSQEPENQGASGWIIDGDVGYFSGQKNGKGPYNKGLVAMSGESALGFYGALQIAASAVFNHPVLGRIGLGCRLEGEAGNEVIIPVDGLGIRMHHLADGWSIILGRDRMTKVICREKKLTVYLKNVTGDEHWLEMKIRCHGQECNRNVRVNGEEFFVEVDRERIANDEII